MSNSTYRYKINSIKLKHKDSFVPGRINVFVGANNCGKTQLLKDMLAFITGTRTDTVILEELDITYPDSWNDLENAYNMKIVDANQSKLIKHISPTFDGEQNSPSHYDLLSMLSNWLSRDKRAFRAATGPGLVSYLNTDNRLKLAMSRNVEPNLNKRGAKNVLESLYMAGSTETETIRKYIRKIFGNL